MLRLVRRFCTLSGTDRTLVLRAFIWIGIIDLGLRARGFRWVLRHARAVPAERASKPVSHEEFARALQYARWIAAVARRFPVPAECLHRALTLHYWLRAEAVPSRLRVGVRLQDAELLAHAWIELDGKPVGDSSAQIAQFAPLRARAGSEVDSLAWT